MQFSENRLAILYQLSAAVIKRVGFDNDGHKGLFNSADIGAEVFGHHHLYLPVRQKFRDASGFLRVGMLFFACAQRISQAANTYTRFHPVYRWHMCERFQNARWSEFAHHPWRTRQLISCEILLYMRLPPVEKPGAIVHYYMSSMCSDSNVMVIIFSPLVSGTGFF